ncbi:undecaprenyldiphospho-muramoylpentapeptide beta-N-acetylglucosaminyltransferase [Phaeovibrio sulfidiphilus]|uniref:UDP-N-acetylglucosamine--N-acetylmuramyl-(pentapeptide) pyrophosphoryl-undecaprenol N-acetylglucosamine transferase n=1 Tax=Phaeovibrio sulfidiphilus TaxID=1220600 RepID=A0A8J7CPV8_9PROT|nr:undecaprenyldiphospho-muramoylpentapeptide beta-N-acetylglucosaminyltransferase [Phaeovibrio sulfidiphilus]MBE1237517.1 undecaprenyldiphospho-muramoylpentapeptide beta-N-acetylglucosaminyltransferase [Phaeovibrio sulfidiphilus]
MTAPSGSQTPLRVALAAGGTGGHVFPAEALAGVLSARGAELVLVTDRRGETYGGTLGTLETVRIRAGGVAGRGLAGRLSGALNLARGYFEARRFLKTWRPDVVVGFGGYASLPPLLAASRLGLPTVIHEQNAIPGRANRMLAPRVRRVATGFPQEKPAAGIETVLTGMPVRPAVLALRDTPYEAAAVDGPFELLVTGGSQGAQVFSDLLPEALGRLSAPARARLHITQQCRPERLEETRLRYLTLGLKADLAPFFSDLPGRLVRSHLAVCRSGASTVGELCVLGRPAILVPYPHAIDDHQSANARVLDRAGGGWLMSQKDLTPALLAARIEALMGAPDDLSRAAAAARSLALPDAADRLADLVFDTAREGARR